MMLTSISVAENKKKHTSAATNAHETFKTEFTPLKELAFTGLVQKQMFVWVCVLLVMRYFFHLLANFTKQVPIIMS